MNKRLLESLLAAAVSLAGASQSGAAPVTWNLSGVTFDDGGTASGSFVFDATTREFSAWSIAIVQGTVSALPTFTYSVGNSKDTGCVGTDVCFDTMLANTMTGDTIRQIGFTPSAALTDAGGTLGITLGFEESCHVDFYSGPTNWALICSTSEDRVAFSGLLVADVGGGSAPEPNSMLLLSVAGLGAVAAQRRRGKAPQAG